MLNLYGNSWTVNILLCYGEIQVLKDYPLSLVTCYSLTWVLTLYTISVLGDKVKFPGDFWMPVGLKLED